jgi:membrane protease YdiL (CAAX protease family)
MGLTRLYWHLSAVLVGSAAVFGSLTGVLTRATIAQVLALTGIGIFVNALPEELFFRGLLLPRLEKVFSNPLNALVVAALLFNATHVPAALVNGAAPLNALLDVISIGYPSGLIWGYLYMRTRSILPGMFWHAANGNLGFLMMSL